MKYADTLRSEMLTRADGFGTQHAASFPVSTLGGQLFAQVHAAVLELGRQAATEISGHGAAHEGTSTKAVARTALRRQLKVISRTAQALAIVTPGFDEKFQKPRGYADQTLLNTARAFAQDAAPLAGAFVAHAMPETFLATLNEAIAAFEQSMQDRQAGKGTHITAHAGIEATLEAGCTAVRRLDAIVANQFRDDPVTVLLWEKTRHVEQPPRKTKSGSAKAGAAAATPAAPVTPAS